MTTDRSQPLPLAGLCTGVAWAPEGIRLGFGHGAEARTALLAPGDGLALAVEGARLCVGYRDGDAVVPCPDNAPATRLSHCERCFRRTGFKQVGGGSFRSSHAHRVAGDERQEQRFVVYLASYAPGYDRRGAENFLKVGISAERRVQRRLSEQGTREALVIAAGSELDVLRLETAIANLDHRRGEDGTKAAPDRRRVKDRLNAEAHVAAWQTPHDADRQLGELYRKLQELHRRLPSPCYLSEPVEMELPELPQLSAATTLAKARGLVLRGTVVANYGLHLIVAADSGAQLALPAKALVGYCLRTLADDEHGQAQLVLAL